MNTSRNQQPSPNREVTKGCEVCLGTGGVRVPCMRCKNGEPQHPHKCEACGGTGRYTGWYCTTHEQFNWNERHCWAFETGPMACEMKPAQLIVNG